MAKRAAPEPVQPTIELKAFSCAHCGALTTQHWRRVFVSHQDKDVLPIRVRDADTAKKQLAASAADEDQRQRLYQWVDRVATGLPSIGNKYENRVFQLNNVDVSECYHCGKVALWVGDNMIWPHPNEAPPPNPDLPDEVAADYSEAGDIVSASPRGAAALLRLAIQKLSKHLGEPGKNINDDIAALVKKGLDPRVQKALDVVRVIGNNAVHPGEIDLRDNRETAQRLFALINLIADIMISQPKAVHEIYDGLGPGPLAAIEKRDRPNK